MRSLVLALVAGLSVLVAAAPPASAYYLGTECERLVDGAAQDVREVVDGVVDELVRHTGISEAGDCIRRGCVSLEECTEDCFRKTVEMIPGLSGILREVKFYAENPGSIQA